MMKLPETLSLGKVVVVDIERTCWEDPIPDERSEIIEVGVCLLTVESLEISRPRRIFVKPTTSKISEFCTKLTGITDDIIATKGVTTAAAYEILVNEYKLNERVWAGWGWDNVRMQEQLPQPNQQPFSPSYIDICGLFSIIHRSPRRFGLLQALALLNQEPIGSHHSAGDDAYNAARVLRYIVENARRQI
jgi:inhibitor of KinA sporulation pathway (predicted exonuclease)